MEKNHIDLQCSLFYEVEYKTTVKLKDFTDALRGIENEYFRYCNRIAKSRNKQDKQLLKEDRILDIKKITQGSIIIELCNTIMPLLADINNLYTFGCTLKSIYDLFLTDKIPTIEELQEKNISKNTLQNAQKIICPAVDNKEIKIELSINGNNNRVVIGDFDHFQAGNISKKISQVLPLLEEMSEDDIYTKVYMYWDNTSFHSSKHFGKVIIQDIDKKPHTVAFQNNSDYEFCTTKNDQFESDWQYLLYRVDVKIVKVGTKISAYDIISVYPDDVIEQENS